MGDHILYHNMARFTAFSHSFKYTFLTSFFPHPKNYYSATEYDFLKDFKGDLSGISMYMGHRLEARFLKDKMNFALTESIMFESDENFLDLQIINPSMLYHNYYIGSIANSILSLELDYTPWKYFNIYSQLIIDEYSLPTESKPGEAASANPMATGLMLGIKGNYPLEKGILTGSIEFVKTDPFLYLRDGKDDVTYGLDFIVATRIYADASTPSFTFHEEAIGYEWGNDIAALNLNIGYKQYGKWEVSGNALFLWDGTYDIWTVWSRVTNANSPEHDLPIYKPSPTDDYDEKLNNYKDKEAIKRDSVSFMTNLTLKGSYSILDYLKVYGQLDFYNIQNPGNLKANKAINDVQLTIGIGISH